MAPPTDWATGYFESLNAQNPSKRLPHTGHHPSSELNHIAERTRRAEPEWEGAYLAETPSIGRQHAR